MASECLKNIFTIRSKTAFILAVFSGSLVEGYINFGWDSVPAFVNI